LRLVARKKNICANASVIMMKAMPLVRSETTPMTVRPPVVSSVATPVQAVASAAASWTSSTVAPLMLGVEPLPLLGGSTVDGEGSPLGCEGGWTAADLNAALRGHQSGPSGMLGMDYARVQLLPGGRALWVFQDVFLNEKGGTLADADFVHNAGLVQDGSCFHLLTGGGGTRARPHSWIGGDTEVRLQSWLWPLDSVLTADGNLAQFMVEMSNPNGTGAAEGAVPVRVWIATITLPDLVVTKLQRAPDAGDRPLYGFSITSDNDFTYMYGNCYRQFTDHGYLGFHDTTCGPKMYVARVPRGRPDLKPEYWDGHGWSAARSAARPVMSRGQMANPMQIRRTGDTFTSVTKLDDWWGSDVIIDSAHSPTGPWREIARVRPEPVCAGCNTYFAQLLPWTDTDGAWLVVLSNNTWNFADANRDTARYRPSILRIHPIPVRSVPPTLTSPRRQERDEARLLAALWFVQ
jgi:hypothetical protein